MDKFKPGQIIIGEGYLTMKIHSVSKYNYHVIPIAYSKDKPSKFSKEIAHKICKLSINTILKEL